VRSHSETLIFAAILAICVAAFFHETLIGDKVLSPADVFLVSASFRADSAGDYEPANRLLMDPALQFQPWLEFNRQMLRSGRLPLWNGHAGCGAPHLANGQSAVFDPFHLIAYLGPTPQAYAWIAAGRLWTAGLGMFLLARAWGLAPYGRWFAGLVYPFSGFLILWLLYPVTSVAIWLPWLILATDRLVGTQNAKAAGWLSLVVALVIMGGHIQTSAHVLLLGGIYAIMRWWLIRCQVWSGGAEASPTSREGSPTGTEVSLTGTEAGGIRAAASVGSMEASPAKLFRLWCIGMALGLGLAAVQVLPLGFYLARSTVWADRRTERPAWWRLARPRLLETVCTAAPYAFGSQRKGHPNLAKALGVQNLNESAGGYVGLATLIWLVPLAAIGSRRNPRCAFLLGVVAFGAMGAFQLPPVDNLLRALPVLNVTDNRRLTLWVAFGLSLLGGIGLDQLGLSHRLPQFWRSLWIVAACLAATIAVAIPSLENALREHALSHYRAAALVVPGASLAEYQERGERQVTQAVRLLPRYYLAVAGELLVLSAIASLVAKARAAVGWTKPALLGLTLCELVFFGFGLNPAIDLATHGFEPPLIERLRHELSPDARVVGVGEELPPNTLMRFGLSDIRNYDSVELARSLSWLVPLYEPAAQPISSRSAIGWSGVARARKRLRESCVGAIVAATVPPPGEFDRTERVGRAWIGWLEHASWADLSSAGARIECSRDHGRAEIVIDSPQGGELVVRETWDPGWRAILDGKSAILREKWGVFLGLNVGKGLHRIILEYDPFEVRAGLALTTVSAVLLILVLTGIRNL
jgi:hypothetical protein